MVPIIFYNEIIIYTELKSQSVKILLSKSKSFVPKWPDSSQNRKLSDFQAEMNDLGQKVDLQQAYRPKSRKK